MVGWICPVCKGGCSYTISRCPIDLEIWGINEY